MLEMQLHTGTTILHKIEEVKNRRWVKPSGGFWTSSWTGSGSGWTSFCETEAPSFAPKDGIWEGVLLKPSDDARIYTIDCYDDLDILADKYSYIDSLTQMTYLDFERMSEDYDAIHLTDNGQGETRMSHPWDLYGWDFESTLWFRAKFDVVQAVSFSVQVNNQDDDDDDKEFFLVQKIKLNNLVIEDIEDPGCNNGHYPQWSAVADNGTEIGGITCGCRNGCSNTDQIVTIDGESFLILYEDRNEE